MNFALVMRSFGMAQAFFGAVDLESDGVSKEWKERADAVEEEELKCKRPGARAAGFSTGRFGDGSSSASALAFGS